MNRMMRWFRWTHLPEALQPISRSVQALAESIDRALPESAEKTAGLRKLLEAKDCFVRAQIEADEAATEKRVEAPGPPLCGLCGEPMPKGEEMFMYHGNSGPCPKSRKEGGA